MKPNPYIEFVEKWHADPRSVTEAELKANHIAAGDAAYALPAEIALPPAFAALASDAALISVLTGISGDGPRAQAFRKAAAHWVKQYHSLTGEH